MEKKFQLTMLRKSKKYLGINLKEKIKRNVKYLSEETITEYKVMIWINGDILFLKKIQY